MSEDAYSPRTPDGQRRQLHGAVREELVQLLGELEEVRRREPAPRDVEQLLKTLRRTLSMIDTIQAIGGRAP